MSLDPQAQAVLIAIADTPPMHTLTPEQVRQVIKMQLAFFDGEEEPIAHVENRKIPGPGGEIPVRVYTPKREGIFPVLIFFHGGGWVMCDLDTHDGLCRRLANGAGCIVVSVDYRLAPEHPFPAALEDCYAVTCWISENAALLHGDPGRIALAGDSAGGNLVAVVSQMVRDRGGPSLVFQLLMYPATDLRMIAPSIDENAEGYFLTKEDHCWFTGLYLNNEEERTNPLASPLVAGDFSRLPAALIITAEYDPLRDEGEQYGQCLKDAGVPTTVTRYAGMIHGFVSLPFDQSKQAIEEGITSLRAAFNKDRF